MKQETKNEIRQEHKTKYSRNGKPE